ncbi:MAG TPA: flagellar assembly protein FliW [Gemmatimonadaceae bacterium]
MSQLKLVEAEPTQLTVRSDLLGDLHIRSTDTLHFDHGLLGFPECRRFAIVRAEHDGLFWLQSMEYSTLVFLLVDPFVVVREYSIDVAPSQLAELGAYRPADIGLLSVVTLPSVAGDSPTANLQGPIAINFATRMAKQLVLSETDYGVRCPIDLKQLTTGV